MTITNTELAAQLQDVATSWQSFNLQQLNWLTTTDDTVTLTDHVTLQEITVKSLYKIEADYDAIFDDATGDLAQIEQMLTDTQALQASMTTMHDAVVSYDVTFTGYLAQTAQDVTDCDDSAAAAAASALAAANSAIAAGGHADDAEAARDLAQGYRNEAETFKNQAQTAKTDAESEAAAALTSRNEALTFRNEAQTSQTSAATSETNAGASEAKAEKWAEELEDIEVELGKYSALHHATKASTSAAAASTSETNAANSAAAASTSETNAEASATAAATSETNALTYKNDASASANSAANSEGGAQTWNQNAQLAKDAAETARDKAQQWANEDEDVQVETGQYSAKHYKEKAKESETVTVLARDVTIAARDKAEEWAQNPYGVEVETGQYSASHWAVVSMNFANEDEDVVVIPGVYSAKHHALKAEDAATAAATSETNADTSDKSAAASATAAATSENNAATSESNASASANSAANYASQAQTNAGNSSISAFNAAASEDKAEKWAEELEDVTVEVGKYSALHHAAKAEASAIAAANSASSASTSETNAATSASNASTSETNAATSATNAATSETNAATSASDAAASAASINNKVWGYCTAGTGLTGIGSSDQDLLIDNVTAESNVGDFTVASNEITFTKAKTYEVVANFALRDGAVGTSLFLITPQKWNGVSWTNIFRCKGLVEVGGGNGHSVAIPFIVSMSANNKIRFRVSRYTGVTTSAYQINNTTTINIKEL